MHATTLTDRTDATTDPSCPDCGAPTVSVQGLFTCGTCRWHGSPRDE
jgi:transposase-like protein